MSYIIPKKEKSMLLKQVFKEFIILLKHRNSYLGYIKIDALGVASVRRVAGSR